MKKAIFWNLLACFIVSMAFSILFYAKVNDHNHYINELIKSTLSNTDAKFSEKTVITLSKEIYRRTNRVLDKKELDWYSRLESTSYFNVTSAISLRYGGFGIKGHPVLGPCGTMSRVLLNAL